MIKSKDEMPANTHIDLTGPEGNAYVLMGYASRWLKEMNKDPEPVLKEMRSGDYENLLKVFEREFPGITLYR